MIPLHVFVPHGTRRRRGRPTRIAAQPPREVGAPTVFGLLLRSSSAVPLAIALGAMAAAFLAAARTDPSARGTPIEPIAWALGALAAAAIVFAMRRAATLRHLLETGMAVPAVVAGDPAVVLRRRTGVPRSVFYSWSFYGQSFTARSPGLLWTADEARPGATVTLLCDPSEPKSHLVAALYGLEIARD